jgi:hypothetical protein
MSILAMTPRVGLTARSASHATAAAAQSGFTITSPAEAALVPC